MFGKLGQPGSRRLASASSTRLWTPASTSSTPPTATPRGNPRMIVGKALRDRREEAVLATKVWAPVGPGPNQRGPLAQGDPGAGRAQPAPPRHRRHRPLPDPPPRPHDAARGDPLDALRPGAPGQGALPRPAPPTTTPASGAVGEAIRRLGDRRDPLDQRAARLGTLRLPPAAVQHPAAGDGGRALPHVPELRHRQHRLEPARRRLAHRQVPRAAPTTRKDSKRAESWIGDLANPKFQRRLDIVEQLAAAGRGQGGLRSPASPTPGPCATRP